MKMWGIFLIKVENFTFSSRIEAPFLQKRDSRPRVWSQAWRTHLLLPVCWLCGEELTSDHKHILMSYKNLSFHFHKLNHAMKKPLGPLCNPLKLEVIKTGKQLNIFIKSFQTYKWAKWIHISLICRIIHLRTKQVKLWQSNASSLVGCPSFLGAELPSHARTDNKGRPANLGMWQCRNRGRLCLEVHRTLGICRNTGRLPYKTLPSPKDSERIKQIAPRPSFNHRSTQS